ncbi:MAG: hypothetical protein ACE5GZ_10025 [Gammaproteobacteria bacterium]
MLQEHDVQDAYMDDVHGCTSVALTWNQGATVGGTTPWTGEVELRRERQSRVMQEQLPSGRP